MRKRQSVSSLMSLDETPSRLSTLKPTADKTASSDARRRIAQSRSMHNLHSSPGNGQPFSPDSPSMSRFASLSPPLPAVVSEGGSRPAMPSPGRRPVSVAFPSAPSVVRLSTASAVPSSLGHRSTASVSSQPRWAMTDDDLPSPFLRRPANIAAALKPSTSRPSLVTRLAMQRNGRALDEHGRDLRGRSSTIAGTVS